MTKEGFLELSLPTNTAEDWNAIASVETVLKSGVSKNQITQYEKTNTGFSKDSAVKFRIYADKETLQKIEALSAINKVSVSDK